MRMAGLLRADTVACMAKHHGQPAVFVGRTLMLASFPLRMMFQSRQAPSSGSVAAVHYYGPETQTSTVTIRMNARRHMDA